MTAAPFPADLTAAPDRRRNLFWRYLHRPLGVAALLVFLVVVVVAVLAPLLAPYDPNLVDFTITQAPPSAEHPLGGDSAGRDILSRLLYGARTTLYGALISSVAGMVLGVPPGVVAGYFGGRLVDRVFSWVSDGLQSVPGMIVLLIVAAGTGANFTVLMVTIGAFLAPGYFRISRARALAVSREPYIDAARVAGVTTGRILRTHMLRAIYAPIIIQTALIAGVAMGMQAGLQFLGIGSAATPSWGAMMNDGFRNMLNHPLILLWPSIALGVTIAALAFMGSTLADLVSVRTEVPSRRRRARAPRAARRRGDAGRAADGAGSGPAADGAGSGPAADGAGSGRAADGAGSGPAAAGSGPVGSGPGPTGVLAHPVEGSALRIENLRVSYPTVDGEREVVHGISLDAAPGEVLGIVGESGSGKTQTVFSALDLLPAGGAATADGIWIGGREVTRMPRGQRHTLLGTRIGYVPQEPMTNLDPCYPIGHQLVEPLRCVHGMSRAAARQRAREILLRVGISDPERVMAAYPHQISGGMAQRVLIAGAVAGRPSLLVADEPTTALDVTVQAEVLELLRELQREYGMALVIVTHNFGVVADMCDRVVVMKDGRIVEVGPVKQIFEHPQDPYTAELISASLDDAESRRQLDERWALTQRRSA
ncbi:MAG TPA: dipeptide/oligopeptide/nickel ABC transporter permease/ATP-binding protein [Pilimelia sp.]|nr:dipeptide/oligopeptide/nickel ABC transporter permease/ATP-binding protein [Pilimelia sp.]